MNVSHRNNRLSLTANGLLALLFSAVVGCGSNSPNSDSESGDNNGEPAAITRSFHLASTGVQMTPGEGLLFQKHEIIGTSQLADDVDVISIHNDFYGIPWEQFENPDPSDLPQPWRDAMVSLAAYARNNNRPVFLTLQLVHGPGRMHLADRTVINNGTLAREEAWSSECYNFASAADGSARRAQYLNYLEWMMTLFEPRWINLGAEVNAFWHNCRSSPDGEAAWEALVSVINDAYIRAQEIDETAAAMYSVVLSHAYGLDDGEDIGTFPGAHYDDALAALAAINADLLGVSDYPYLHEDVHEPADIPAGWFTRIGADLGLPVIIAETGWSALPLVAEWENSPYEDDCVQALHSSESLQRDYFNYLVDLAHSQGIALITWWSNRDLIIEPFMTSCPVCAQLDTNWCSLVQTWRTIGQGAEDSQAAFFNEATLKIWGTMGIRRYQGAPRQPIFDRWHEVLNRPLVAPES